MSGGAGWKNDQAKPRWDLIPAMALAGVVAVLTFGTREYAPDGWRTVPDARRRYFAALLRHIFAWWMGEDIDPKSGLPHIDHVSCNALFLSELDAVARGYLTSHVSHPTTFVDAGGIHANGVSSVIEKPSGFGKIWEGDDLEEETLP